MSPQYQQEFAGVGGIIGSENPYSRARTAAAAPKPQSTKPILQALPADVE
jgi:hypothetical protein